MAVTTTSNVIKPEVMAAMIDAKVNAQCKATPYAAVDNSLVGNAGNEVSVPAWGYIGDAADVNENSELTPTAMNATMAKFAIKKTGKRVSLTSEAINSGYGDPVGQAQAQLAKAIAGALDEDIMAAARGCSMQHDCGAIISYNGIVDAVGEFEDEEDTAKVIFIHPEQETQLRKDSSFLSADKYAPGVEATGVIGQIAGCNVIKSKRVKKLDAVTAVQGVYTIKIETVASGDKITIAGVTTTLDATSGASASAAVTAIKAGSWTDYNVTGTGATLTFTEKSGHEEAGAPEATSDNTSTVFTITETTKGVKARDAAFACPIIKLEADSAETESELPAITVFLKQDINLSVEYEQAYDRYNLAAYKYYGVARTNEAKLVCAIFDQVASD